MDAQKMEKMVSAVKEANQAAYDMWRADVSSDDKTFRAQATFQISYMLMKFRDYTEVLSSEESALCMDPTMFINDLRHAADMLSYQWSESQERLALYMAKQGLPFMSFAFTSSFKKGKLQLVATQDTVTDEYVFIGSFDSMDDIWNAEVTLGLNSVHVYSWKGPDIGYTADFINGKYYTTATKTLVIPETGEVIVKEGQHIDVETEFYGQDIVTALNMHVPEWSDYLTLPAE